MAKSLAKVLKDIRESFTGAGIADDSITASEWKSLSDSFQIVLELTNMDVSSITNQFSSSDDKDTITGINNHVNKELNAIFWSHFSPRFCGRYKQIWGTAHTPKELLDLAKSHFQTKSDKFQNIPHQLSFSTYQKEPTISWDLTFQKLKTMSKDIFFICG